MSKAKAQSPQQHDHADASKCTHCGLVLKELGEIARLLRLQIPHQIEPAAISTGRCASISCWCRV